MQALNIFMRTYNEQGLSVKEFAEKHKVACSTVRCWVSGSRTPPQSPATEIPYYLGFGSRGNNRAFRVVVLGHRTVKELRKQRSLKSIFTRHVYYARVWANYNPIVGWTFSKDRHPGYFACTVMTGDNSFFKNEALTETALKFTTL